MRTTSKKDVGARSAYWVVIGLVLGIAPKALAQESATILQIQVDNVVAYHDDVGDPSRVATSATIAPPALRTFMRWIVIGDIVAVNGTPAKGALIGGGTLINVTPNPTPSQAIADTVHTSIHEFRFEIQQSDGTPIGSIMASGLAFGPPPPGSPRQSVGGNNAITGGTGAFVGVRGQVGNATASPRRSSMLEDPANRRANGGGPILYILHLIPMSRPEIATTSTGPVVFHADFSPVAAATPARAGEVLILQATGLGPTIPGVDPGRPFPTDASQQVNSPVDVTVNGQSAEVTNKLGWPGLVDTYRVDFRVPDATVAGTASIQLTAAWIAGHSVKIPIQ